MGIVMDGQIKNVTEIVDTYTHNYHFQKRKNARPLPETPPKEDGKGDKVDLYV